MARLLNSLIFLITAIALCLWSCLRLGLWFSLDSAQISASLGASAVLRGLWFDLAALAYLVSPALLIAAVWPHRWCLGRISLSARWLIAGVALFSLGFGVISEVIFWQEFTTRFNFIAVDYLIYTQEVVDNILQSYPVGVILGALAGLVGIVLWAISRKIKLIPPPLSLRQRLILAGVALAFPVSSYLFASVDQMEFSGNPVADELSGNGLFSLAAAMRRNELDYDRFYRTIPEDEAGRILTSLQARRVKASESFTEPAIAKKLPSLGPFSRAPKNIVLISVESLSAEFLGTYGDPRKLTPRLDQLAAEGLKFDRMFATGTRTVRGLEALSIGIPPIPGQSIVRRIGNEHLATIGEMLEHQNFKSFFIYGGYGYFDNMNAYFAANDYEVVDRTDFKKETIQFENVWGVADEFLYDNALLVLDRETKEQKPFFAHIMTTSNHRPFTYPDGRIDIPSPGGRAGAVKYTDYAIGDFIDKAKKKSWFKDTLFVIVADHCHSVAGRTKLPIDKYRIATIFYAPDMLKPGIHTRNASQIDIAPTLLSLLGAKGEHHFFGQSLFDDAIHDERVFVSNYQALGYYKNDKLIVLSPKQKAETFAVDKVTYAATPAKEDPALTREAIAYYQTAARAFKQGELLSPDYRKSGKTH